MHVLTLLLLVFLVVCAIGVSFTKNLLKAVLTWAAFSLVLSLVWLLLQAPDLAITEAAVGAGVDTVLLLITLYKMHQLNKGTGRGKGGRAE